MSCDVSRLRYRGGSVLVPALPICPASRFPHLVISCCLLGLPMSFPLCRLIACVPSSSRAVVPSSHPSSRAILLACRPASRLASRFAARLSFRLSSRSSPRSPLGNVIAALPDRSPMPFGLRSSIAPPCLSVRLGAGRDGSSFSPSPARLAAVACSGWRLACVRFLVAVCSACFGAAVCVCIVMAKLYI